MISKWHALAALPAALLLMVACSQKEAEPPVAEEAAPPVEIAPPVAAGQTKEAMIAEALSAAPPSMIAGATVADWEGNVLKEGAGAYTCLPSPAGLEAPMCMDSPWMAWANAWANKTDLTIDRLGISYMMVGDSGASNIDPYATVETADNEWVVEGAHLMLIAPDSALLDGLPTDSANGGPYVMWKDSPYAHVMVPIDIADTYSVDSPLADALSAANVDMASDAKVVDWEGNVLQDGEGSYTCLPTPPHFADGRAPMCMDGEWMAWANSWMNKEAVSINGMGISYMLAGDEGGSNIDPYGSEPTDDNEWVVSGPHLMIIVPDNSLLADLPTDPENGGPYVMWKDTPYAHVMVPVGD